jgi:hypothetical protein
VPYPVSPVRIAAEIPAPAEAVLGFIADTRNDPLWCDNVETVEMLTPEPIAVGSRFRFHQHLDRPGGNRAQFDVDVEVVHIDDESVTWKVEDRFQEREITIEVTPSDRGCLVTQTTRAAFKRKPGLTARWLYPSMARRIFRRQFETLSERFSTMGSPLAEETSGEIRDHGHGDADHDHRGDRDEHT